ncbi:hypothetical protein BV25DRAFT_1995819 [Artomyces pyxidatus]|uniref:Uncharacterized protein n=1 Tax=Artomyces pyxidatus TaxID=48021 RepID=A0ACB8SIN8_9AGAM|nr:hypothetical protein BV25DRAFT_1995819 [Artomyces pyxidatus]
MSLQILPSDILILIINGLEVNDLVALSETCRVLHALVQDYGWTNSLRLHPRDSQSLSVAFSSWSPLAQIKYHTLTDRAWARTKFAARPLSRPWQGKLQPILAVNTSRLVVAAGHILYSYHFDSFACEGLAPAIRFECSYNLSTDDGTSRRDVTSLAFSPDDGSDRTLFVGFEHGALERLYLPPCKIGQREVPVEAAYRTSYFYHHGELIEGLNVSGTSMLSMSSSGTAAILDLSSPNPTPHMIDLDSRGWSAHLSPSYAALGTSSHTPLAIHPVTNAQLSATPSAILRPSSKDIEDASSSAVYGIAGAPASFPWGASDKIVVSGWYDGFVHVHDLRSSSRATRADPAGPAPLTAVLSLADPWSFEPIYTVSCGGGAASHIAAGSARHSVVAFWDVRSPKTGWSVHAPGNDSSPVYSVVLESSRLFGATQSRPFVYDFGTGVTPETYPPLPRGHGDDGLKYKKGWNDVGFYVTKYSHRTAHVY